MKKEVSNVITKDKNAGTHTETGLPMIPTSAEETDLNNRGEVETERIKETNEISNITNIVPRCSCQKIGFKQPVDLEFYQDNLGQLNTETEIKTRFLQDCREKKCRYPRNPN